MLNTESLKQILTDFFQVDQSHIVPITTNWFVPEVELDGTDYIGYRIMSKRPCSKTSGSIFDETKQEKTEQIRISFRLAFIGKHAEQISDKILDFDKIKSYFDSVKIKLDMNDVTTFTYPLKGSNQMAWLADFTVTSDLENK